MLLLITYVVVAIGFSFACSIMEAVLLSVSDAHVALLEKKGKQSGKLLRRLKDDVSKPLAAILTLNTIAHTIGAAGAGAQAAEVFGNNWVGLASAILTLLILVFSEIIPKTLGAHYWKQLSAATAYTLKYLIVVLYPFVRLSDALTRQLIDEPTLSGFSREEFAAMAELSSRHGKIGAQESRFLKNLLKYKNAQVRNVMTPRTVIFSLSADSTVEQYYHQHDKVTFSRIPIFDGEPDNIVDYVFRSDLFLAQARGNGERPLGDYGRDLHSLLETSSISQALNELLAKRVHMMLVVDEYGSVVGLLTLEDILEAMLGLEIVDEKDQAGDMRKLAKKLWLKKAKSKGLDIETR